MSRSATSVFVFGVYLSVLALGWLLIPNKLLNLLGLPTTDEVWIRVVGMLLLGLAYYYIQTARLDDKLFFRFSTQARALVIVFFVVFVLLDLVEPGLLVLGFIDLLAATWTALALRSESEPVFKIL